MMPMFRVFSNGYCLSNVTPSFQMLGGGAPDHAASPPSQASSSSGLAPDVFEAPAPPPPARGRGHGKAPLTRTVSRAALQMKRGDRPPSVFLGLRYQRQCAKALFASAIRCVSSLFLTAVPRLLAASKSSAASFSSMLFSLRLRADPMIHRMDSEVRRSGRTSTGT